MLKKEVVIGQTYLMNHSSGRIKVRILREKNHRHMSNWSGETKNMTYWEATNLSTGRLITLKSAGKLMRAVTE